AWSRAAAVVRASDSVRANFSSKALIRSRAAGPGAEFWAQPARPTVRVRKALVRINMRRVIRCWLLVTGEGVSVEMARLPRAGWQKGPGGMSPRHGCVSPAATAVGLTQFVSAPQVEEIHQTTTSPGAQAGAAGERIGGVASVGSGGTTGPGRHRSRRRP